MNKINIAKLLKDCPKGMELDCTMYDNAYFEQIDEKNNNYPIVINIGNSKTISLTKEGHWNKFSNAKCIIFPKGKTTWEGFTPPYQFKGGDIIFKDNFITIVSYIESSGRIWYHCWYNIKYKESKFKNDFGIGDINDGDEVRFATEEEKQELFKAIKDKGYRWNPETKSLEKLPKFKMGDRIKYKNDKRIYTIVAIENNYYFIQYFSADINDYRNAIVPIKEQDKYELLPNKFDFSKLKPFDKVLVRYRKDNDWTATFFSHTDEKLKYHCYKFITTNGSYPYVIPYEGNEHLLGTTDNCDEYFRVWE